VYETQSEEGVRISPLNREVTKRILRVAYYVEMINTHHVNFFLWNEIILRFYRRIAYLLMCKFVFVLLVCRYCCTLTLLISCALDYCTSLVDDPQKQTRRICHCLRDAR
jgi:hypothetical protein